MWKLPKLLGKDFFGKKVEQKIPSLFKKRATLLSPTNDAPLVRKTCARCNDVRRLNGHCKTCGDPQPAGLYVRESLGPTFEEIRAAKTTSMILNIAKQYLEDAKEIEKTLFKKR